MLVTGKVVMETWADIASSLRCIGKPRPFVHFTKLVSPGAGRKVGASRCGGARGLFQIL